MSGRNYWGFGLVLVETDIMSGGRNAVNIDILATYRVMRLFRESFGRPILGGSAGRTEGYFPDLHDLSPLATDADIRRTRYAG
jgi:hypothetical protein